MSPLEKAIAEMEINRAQSSSGNTISAYSVAISICQRILSEEKPMPEVKRWEMESLKTRFMYGLLAKELRDTRYEPFAVDKGIIYFKRPVCDK